MAKGNWFVKYNAIYEMPPIPGQKWVKIADLNTHLSSEQIEQFGSLMSAAPQLLEALEDLIMISSPDAVIKAKALEAIKKAKSVPNQKISLK